MTSKQRNFSRGLTNRQIDELRLLYLSFTNFAHNRKDWKDVDISNPTTTVDVFLDKESLHRVLTSMGAPLSIENCANILRRCNQQIQSSSLSSSSSTSINDKLTFASFIGILSEYIPSLSPMEQLKEVWSMLDTDHDGRVPFYHLRRVIVALLNDKNDEESTIQKVDDMLAESWHSSYMHTDRLISFTEFVQFMQT